MGEDVAVQQFTGAHRAAFRAKVHRCLDTFSQMLSASRFDTDDPLTGLEVELHLVDDAGDPALKNVQALEAIANPAFQTELGRFNLEFNVAPRRLAGRGLADYEAGLRSSLNEAERRAAAVDAHLVMVGILPTLGQQHMTWDSISPNPRYRLLGEQILAARGEDLVLDIEGHDHLQVSADSILPEAACTSFQLHVQVSPDQFAAYWNASQAIAGVQLALGANAPFLFGRQLWAETRIPLFLQATDTRSDELKAQGVRPRVWYGERWITSVFDLFEENVRYFGALLPIVSDEEPGEVLAAGGVPSLPELRLHNGTIYRWNRPVYDVVGGVPHLRVENRTLAAGPTVVDMMANAAFYFGLVRTLAEQDRPVWSQLSFATAEDNFLTGARDGIDAEIYWPGSGQAPVTEVVLRTLLPLAAAGLDAWGVDRAVAEHYLGVIEGRCKGDTNGASWWMRHWEARRGHSAPDPIAVLRQVLTDYRELMHSNAPVHTWD